jgi:type IV pilus assembly protein PilN
MLVEINLLPKKEPKNVALFAILLSALFIMLVAGLILFWQGTRLDSEVKGIDNQIKTTQSEIQAEQAKQANKAVATESIAQLESAVQWAGDEPLKSAPILKKMVELLPERGFIQNISYTGAGTLTLTVQFDTSREAAYFYKTLLDAEWISDTKLSGLQTTEPTENAAEGSSEQFIPRYTGQYSVTLNRDFINSEEKSEQSKASEEGGNEL